MRAAAENNVTVPGASRATPEDEAKDPRSTARSRAAEALQDLTVCLYAGARRRGRPGSTTTPAVCSDRAPGSLAQLLLLELEEAVDALCVAHEEALRLIEGTSCGAAEVSAASARFRASVSLSETPLRYLRAALAAQLGLAPDCGAANDDTPLQPQHISQARYLAELRCTLETFAVLLTADAIASDAREDSQTAACAKLQQNLRRAQRLAATSSVL